MPTISDLLTEAEPVVEKLGEEPTMFEPEPPITIPSPSEMIDHPADMDREDSQLVRSHGIVESMVPLVEATVDKPISEELI